MKRIDGTKLYYHFLNAAWQWSVQTMDTTAINNALKRERESLARLEISIKAKKALIDLLEKEASKPATQK